MGTKYTVKATGETNTKTKVVARNFQITIDEPPSLGGSDHGPNPVEYVLSALCGCIHVIGYIVAKQMDITLNGLVIEADGEFDDNRPGFSNIQVRVSPDTDADNATLEKWLQAVDKRCPVSDNLINPTPVEISLQ